MFLSLFKYWLALVSLLLTLCGFTFPGQRPAAHLAILCYHHINSPSGRPYSSTLEQFDTQIRTLKKAGFAFISLQQVENYYYKGSSIPEKSIALTFDDASMTVYRDAYPYLKKNNIPFALFIYPSITQYGQKKYACTWAQLKEMQANGVTMGCHSYYHPILASPGLGDRVYSPEGYAKWLKLQTAGAKQILEENLGVSINYFAIPFGAADTTVHQAIKAAGYTLCFNVSGGNNDAESSPLNLNRTIVLTKHTAQDVLSIVTPRLLDISTSPNNFARIYADDVTISISVENTAAFISPYIFEGTFLPERVVTPDTQGHITLPVHLRKPGFFMCSLRTTDKQGKPYKGTWLFIYTKKKPSFLL